MASILDVSVSSDSEDDADYVPTGEVAPSDSSGDENSCDDERETPKPKRAKTKKSAKAKEGEETSDSTPAGDSKGSNVDPKKHADDIWKSFLSEVESSATKSSTMTSSDENKTESPSAPIPVEAESKAVEIPAAKVFEFAGETFTADNDYKPASVEAKPAESASSAEAIGTQGLAKKRGGIDSVLGTLLNKKQKMTTLQKTLYDWKSFKKDEGIEEDLEKFNKGRGGFIERQRFLQRSDVRSFEAEKSVRQSKKKK